jgi:hypothetical protein
LLIAIDPDLFHWELRTALLRIAIAIAASGAALLRDSGLLCNMCAAGRSEAVQACVIIGRTANARHAVDMLQGRLAAVPMRS